ncbi:MAG: peptide chain release factor 2 [Anaerolineales bacterium]
MEDLISRLNAINEKVRSLMERLDLPAKEKQLAALEAKSHDPNLWNNPQEAQKTMRAMSQVRETLESWRKAESAIADALELAGLGDDSMRADLEAEVTRLETQTNKLEFETLLAGRHDNDNVIFTIFAGAGGTEAQDWVSILYRMYLRFCENRGYRTEVLDLSDGEEAGIKSVTLGVEGPYAFGYLKSEKGTHRLVRLSPFDSAHRRHTSFASVEVYPQVDDVGEIEINPNDIEIDTYRASSAGGQNVQKNATAIRIKHLPTGLVVTCQNERSLTQNRENAMKVLRARLLALREEERAKEITALKGDRVKAEWGQQIRSYVLHPYQMVKDHRTDFETGRTDDVLNGELDPLIEAYLRSQVGSN